MSLLTGKMSIAIFYACLFKASGKLKFKKYCQDIVKKVIDKMDSTEMSSGLCNGFTGVAWGINYISQIGILDIGDENFFEEVDELIYSYSLSAVQNGQYDFMHRGLSGAVYALDRLPNKEARLFLHQIVNALDGIKETDEYGIKWDDKLSERPVGMELMPKYSLGLAHGIPGIISLLLRMFEEEINKPIAEQLINGSIHWILKHKLSSSSQLSIFPDCITGSLKSALPSKLAWCYGDLCIAYVLFNAAKIFDNRLWLSEALSIMQHSCGRREALNNPHLDAMFCHGTSGISYLFNKFYYLTGDERYLKESNFWLEKTLTFAVHRDAPGGYKKMENPQYSIWVNGYGILDGIAGIGLTFLSFLKPDLDWDKSMLLYHKSTFSAPGIEVNNNIFLKASPNA